MRTPSPSRTPTWTRRRGRRSRPRPAASPSARSSTRRSATPCPAASNGAPIDTLKLVADGLWTHLHDPQIGYNQSYYFPYGFDQNGNGTWSDSSATIKNGVVTGVTSSNFTPEIVNNTINRNVVTDVYGLNGTWKPTRQVFARLRCLSLDREPSRGRHRYLRDGRPGVDSAHMPRTSSPSPTCRTVCRVST